MRARRENSNTRSKNRPGTHFRSLGKKIKTNVFTILSLRNHFPIYDIETLIEAFSVFSNDKNVNLIIAGYGDLTKSYQRMVEDRSIKNKVNYM